MNSAGTNPELKAGCTLPAINDLPLPNLIIPGSQKGGTSTLFSWLDEHPQCLMANPKEPMFFSRKQTYDRAAYSQYFAPKSLSKRRRIIGEASTTYLSFPHVAGRIAENLGTNVKFIFVLRDPVRRAVSAYWHMAKRFHELRPVQSVLTVGSARTEVALTEEDNNIRRAEHAGTIVTDGYQESLGDRYWSFRYVRNSLYLNDLQRFESYFGRSNMLVLLTDDLATRPLDTFDRVADFIGIDRERVPPTVGKTHNETRVLPQTRLTRILYRMLTGVPMVGRSIRSRFVNAVSSPTPPIPAEVRDSLTQLFSTHNQNLSQYLNRDLSHWSTPAARTGLSDTGVRDAA